MRRALHDQELRGAADAARVREGQARAACLRLGRFGEVRTRTRLLLRMLPALRIPPLLLAAIGCAARRPGWQRFALVFAYWHGVRSGADRRLWRQLTSGVVVLMYHAFTEHEPAGAYITPARRFALQLALLRLTGWRLLTMEEFLAYRQTGDLPPPRSVVLTIDDGYRDMYDVAFRLLKRWQAHATVFAVSGLLGGANVWDRDGRLARRPLLTVQQLREMAAAGVSVGAHTRTHPMLPRLSDVELERELAGSRADLSAFGAPPAAFAYPFGETSESVRAAVRRAGFSAAFGVETGINGPATADFALRRVPVCGNHSLLRFALGVITGDPHIVPCRRPAKALASA
ncbi:MAG TPA: polysaccharide deacetylase family protein [Chloroflexota bacterium]|nr:polysaccharide deacetylase family protein [Chloroflexota bacterium]